MPFDAVKLKLKLSCADDERRTFEFEIRHGEKCKSDILLKLWQEGARICKLASPPSRITLMQITVRNIFDKQKGGHGRVIV